jgi:hypothetical protein
MVRTPDERVESGLMAPVVVVAAESIRPVAGQTLDGDSTGVTPRPLTRQRAREEIDDLGNDRS